MGFTIDLCVDGSCRCSWQKGTAQHMLQLLASRHKLSIAEHAEALHS